MGHSYPESRQSPSSRASFMARAILYVVMFYVIYTPQIGDQNPLIKLIILAVLPLVLNIPYALSHDPTIGRILTSKPVGPLILWSVVGAFYVAMVILASDQAVSSFADLRLVQNSTLALMLINVVFIVDLLARTGHDWMRSFEVVLWLGAAQGVFAIAGLLVPAIHDISRSFYVAVGGTNYWVIKDRIYGVSSDFTYATQIYHGILAAVAVYVMFKERRLYVVQIGLILATSLLNGRTGTLAFIAMVVIITVVYFLRRMNLLAIILGLTLLWGASYLAYSLLQQYASATFVQLNNFFDDSQNLLQRNKLTGNYAVLVPEFQRMPTGIDLIFGTGIRLYTGQAGDRTDIGFTNDIFAGGLIFVILLYGAFVIFLFRTLKQHVPLLLALIVAAVIADLKGEMFRSTTLLFVFTFVPLVMMFGRPRTRVPKQHRVPARIDAFERVARR